MTSTDGPGVPLSEETTTSSNSSSGGGGSGAGAQHRFFFMNDILCRTETRDASFRPADVFVARDPPPRRTAVLGDASRVTDAAAARPGSADVDSDCPIFNTFGILSGGVLLDPSSSLFVDFIDDIVVRPAVPRKDKDKDEESENVKCYMLLEYSKIKAEGVMCLCSSIEPFNAPGTKYTPLAWPRSRLLVTPTNARSLALRNVRRILRRCAAEAPVNREMLITLEGYRCHIKSTRPQLRFMTERIPFRFQYGGRALSLLEDENDNNSNNNIEEKEANNKKNSDHNDGGGGDGERCLPPTPGSRFSEFHTFSGLPKMAHRKHEEKVAVVPGRSFAKRLEMEVQRSVRPLRQNFFIGKRPRRDTRETEFKKSWWTFLRYFSILRVYSSPSPTPTAENCVEWHLADDQDVKYKQLVQEFEKARENGTAPRLDMEAAVDAWDWLLRHERDRLLRRIAKVKHYLKKLGS